MVTANDSENKLAKVLWQCRRGLLELDMMLQDFCSSNYLTMTPQTQILFEELLESEDQDLQRWLIGSQPAEPKFQDLILVIRHVHAKSQQGQPA